MARLPIRWLLGIVHATFSLLAAYFSDGSGDPAYMVGYAAPIWLLYFVPYFAFTLWERRPERRLVIGAIAMAAVWTYSIFVAGSFTP